MSLYFKHVFGPGANEWGVLGFTSAQPAAAAMKIYKVGSYVLLAAPMHVEAEYPCPENLKGKIFARCTLLPSDRPAKAWANPEMVQRMPNIVERWSTAAPLHRYWRLEEAVSYRDFSQLAHQAKSRGRLFEVQERAVLSWHEDAAWKEEPVYHCQEVAANMKRMGL